MLSGTSAESNEEWPLPAEGSHRFGPWSDGGPWLTRAADNTIIAWHAATGVQRTVSDADCRVERSTTTAEWVVAWCSDGRLVQWPWGDSWTRREYTVDDKVWTPVDVSADGRRVLVRQYTDSLSEHYSKPVVLERGRPIWEDPSRSALLGLAPSGGWLLTSSPSGLRFMISTRVRSAPSMVECRALSSGSLTRRGSGSSEPVERSSLTVSKATECGRTRPIGLPSSRASRRSWGAQTCRRW